MKHKTKVALIGLFLAIAGIVGLSVPAQAASGISYDCWPAVSGTVSESSCTNARGTYLSSDSHASAGGFIEWNANFGSAPYVEVEATRITDLNADGYAPRVKVVYNGQTKVININGSNQVFFDLAGASAGLTIYMCNGGNDTSPSRCSAAHGPFHSNL